MKKIACILTFFVLSTALSQTPTPQPCVYAVTVVINSAGHEDFVAMTSLTLGTNNSRPLVGPVVISEIMYQPPLNGTNEDFDAEFIELQNVTATNVPLYATDFPPKTWRLNHAVDYRFPTNVVLPPDGRVLVVGFDPATNTLAGAFYLSKVLKRYRGTDNPVPYGLADYNAGRANVLKWNTGEASTNSAAFIEAIGFPGTKKYVLSVMRRFDHYRPIFLKE